MRKLWHQLNTSPRIVQLHNTNNKMQNLNDICELIISLKIDQEIRVQYDCLRSLWNLEAHRTKFNTAGRLARKDTLYDFFSLVGTFCNFL